MTEPRVEAGDRALETARKPTFERKVTIERAELALHRLINSHFNNNRETHPHARMTIPANQDDDDLVLSDFIAQERELRAMLRKLIATCKISTLFSPCPLDLNNQDATFEDDFSHTILEAERLLAERGEAH